MDKLFEQLLANPNGWEVSRDALHAQTRRNLNDLEGLGCTFEDTVWKVPITQRRAARTVTAHSLVVSGTGPQGEELHYVRRESSHPTAGQVYLYVDGSPVRVHPFLSQAQGQTGFGGSFQAIRQENQEASRTYHAHVVKAKADQERRMVETKAAFVHLYETFENPGVRMTEEARGAFVRDSAVLRMRSLVSEEAVQKFRDWHYPPHVVGSRWAREVFDAYPEAVALERLDLPSSFATTELVSRLVASGHLELVDMVEED